MGTLQRKAHPYYNFDKLASYQGTYNFLVGGRGLGKTYGSKERATKRFFKRGEQFIYLRRYKPELAAAMSTFFADYAHKFPDYDFRVMNRRAECSPVSARDDKKREWQTMGYFIALSTAQGQKSVSFPKVTTIIYDEFIIEKGSVPYLQNEANAFNNFYVTVDRFQDKTTVFFLANSVSIKNPYFIAYKIRPDEEKEFVIPAQYKGFVVCHFPDADNYQSSVFNTAFGQFIAGTEYADFAVSNKFKDNNDNLIQLKGSRSRCQYIIETKDGKFSVWYDNMRGEYFVSARLPNNMMTFTMVPENVDVDKKLILFNDIPMQQLRTAFRTGKLLFDDPSTRNVFVEVFNR